MITEQEWLGNSKDIPELARFIKLLLGQGFSIEFIGNRVKLDITPTELRELIEELHL